MLLTDTDIIKLLGKEIVIEPFEEDSLTPVGYDLRVGEFVYSLSRGLLVPDVSGEYTIKPGESILVLTNEFVWVSDRIGGTIHSKVTLVSQGFSHISTTLDPRWSGPLLIATGNRGDTELNLSTGQSFATLLLYKTNSRATRPHKKPPARQDVLLQLLIKPTVDTEEDVIKNLKLLIEKVFQIIQDSEVQAKFCDKVKKASDKGLVKVLQATRSQLISRGGYYFIIFLHILLLALIVSLALYFDSWLKPAFPQVFSNVDVDSEFFAGALGATVVVLVSLVSRLNKE